MGRYLWAAGLARLADEMVAVAVVVLALSRSGSTVLSGAVIAAYTVPSILSGPLLGAWLDRTRRPVAALAANQVALAAMATAMVFAPAPWLVPAAFVAGVTLPMTSGGFTSLVPRLATDLPRATAQDALLFNVAAIGGPGLAGVLGTVASPAVAVAAVAALASAGALCTTALRVPPHPPTEHPSLVAAMKRGLRHLVTTPPLRGATVASAVGYGSVGMLATALPTHLGVLGVGEDRTGLVWAAFEVGCVVSVLAVRRRLPRWRPERVVCTAIALYGVTLALWPLTHHFPVLLGLALVSGLAQGPTLTATITARQRYTPGPLLGQVSTTGASVKLGAFAIGAAGGGALLTTWSTAAVILLVAAGQWVGASLGAVTSRPTRTAPVTP
ncbi:putative MFS family arabinose efflux permease [Saccharothrix saharensis]|uniref:Putative MFS family arabinose efflux permease n=1 Tax=Saccharothrix saharensis TaxID=571190 RepID=A0A543JPC9_9PSEU|nr:MFS transporter [Saccharothrix saharensis]TQM84673.1 putative MFS family arabinose efflux permease [Saccharothrix saharensis]